MIAADLAKFPLFTGLSSAECEIVAEAIEVEDIPAGVSLFREGDPADGALFVVTGRIRVHAAEIDGEAESNAGDALGVLSLVDRGPRLTSAETLSRSRIFRLRRGGFRNLMAAAPAVACHLLEWIARESAHVLRADARRGAAAVDPAQTSD